MIKFKELNKVELHNIDGGGDKLGFALASCGAAIVTGAEELALLSIYGLPGTLAGVAGLCAIGVLGIQYK